MTQTQQIPVIEVRDNEYQVGYEGEGHRGRGGIFGLVPHGRRQYGNQPQGGEPREAYVNQEYGQELREEHGTQYQGEVQRRYYNNNQVGEGRRNYYGDQGGNGGRDVRINSIKTILIPFKGECNPDVYLEWESLCERIFQINDLTEVKKSFFSIAQFDGFSITWWEYMKKYHLVLQDGHPPLLTGLKAFMRVKYVPERYRQELRAKWYNLRQGGKSVAAYYDEFQTLILKLEYNKNEEHVVIRFKVG
ncbi:hypothetical protein KY289_030636 [Solanum tuberosum]|nr:hypothetical protein KY289_030636 [Solanum tuberosum]